MSADQEKLRSYLEKVTLDLRKARRRLQDLEQSSEEPIAITGMGCRFPGGVQSPRGLWELLSTETDAISSFPTDRGWDLGSLYHPDPDQSGTSYVQEGGFVDDVARFDPAFFQISPREAPVIDPQQRLMLEVAWEALEDAGVDPHSLHGTRTGVFAGTMYEDYGWLLNASRELQGVGASVSSGSVIAGRIAYVLGLEGPAMAVDTACSSSLVSLHLACDALRRGDCSLALAGGITIASTPSIYIESSRQRALSPDGRCKAFSESADGTGFSEGAGLLVLRRLSDAQREGHPVLALLRGSAVNQDGASNGFTAPNGPSQERVIRQALENARLTPQDIDAVEAHGTGTMLGDPIEAGALIATYGQERERPFRLGSIKSNIGHSLAAAGVAGVIKMVMAMREGVLPKTLHVDQPSTKIDWEAGKVELLTEPQPWEANGRPRRAAVSSFGASGTNAHLILEEAPAPEALAEDPQRGEGHRPLPAQIPLPLSAKTEPALQEAASRLASHLRENQDLSLEDLAYSLATTRASFGRRGVLVTEDRSQLLEGLAALSAGEEHPRLARGTARPDPRPVFLFPGQGSQWLGMGVDLRQDSEVFAAKMAACEEALAPHIDFSVEEVLRGGEGAPSIEQVEVVQPALFAVMVSLAELWRSCGVEPAAVIGHSQGEIAAAHVCGGLSLSDAARLIALRSQLISTVAGEGSMASIVLSPNELDSRLERWEGRISIAAYNGPSSAIVAGDCEALDQLLAQCEAEGVRARRLPAAVAASHSHHIEVLREPVLEIAAPISPQSGDIPFYSTVTGGLLDTEELDAGYWYRNMREPVLFEQTTRGLLDAGQRIFLEISPHPVFAFAVEETIEDSLTDPGEATVLSTLRREEGGADRFALSLAQAHAHGATVDWDTFFKGTAAKRVPLPTYPFQRKRYWLEGSTATGDLGAAGLSDAEHPLLGASLALADSDRWLFTARLSLQSHPWLKDHAAAGTVLLPGTAFLELALEAGRHVGAETVAELTLQAPLILPEQGAVALQVSVGEGDAQGEREISIHSRLQGQGDLDGEPEWSCHAMGTLSPQAPTSPRPLTAWPPQGAQALDLGDLYTRLADVGLEYGPAFQNARAAWKDGEELFLEIALGEDEAQEAPRFGLHPALLDCAGHTGIGVTLEGSEADSDDLALPFAWQGVRLHGRGSPALRARLALGGDDSGLVAFDQTGAPAITVDSLMVRPVSPMQLRAARGRRSLHRVEWIPVPLSQRPAAGSGEEGEDGLTIRRCEPGEEVGPANAAGTTTAETLAMVQEWLAAERADASRLAVVTCGAIAAVEGESPELSAAPVWGLLRSAQSEHPDAIVLIDADDPDVSDDAIVAAAGTGEPQLALRGGEALAPRLVAAKAIEDDQAGAIDPGRTVLVTGGTSGLGALVARHLASTHGARHLLLASRRGREADGIDALEAGLGELGAEVTVAACDVSDRAQLEAMLEAIPGEHRLGAIVHCAAALDDGMFDSLDPERLRRTMGPKADAAWHLHELTEDLELSHFLMFSSTMGVLGGSGQANYAAANVFLDALAAHRQARGLVATSLAWGAWARQSDLLEVDDEQILRMGEQIRMRLGLVPMTPEQGLALFDAAMACDEPLLVPAEFDRTALLAQAKAGVLSPILTGLVPASRSAPEVESLRERLVGVPEDEREGLVLQVVRGHVAVVLGQSGAEEVEPERAFQELGLDSLGAVELRNRLTAATGLRLPPTLAFDYPSAAAVAGHLTAEIAPDGGDEGERGEAEFREALARVPLSRLREAGVMGVLTELTGRDVGRMDEDGSIDEIDEMDIDDLVERTLEVQADSEAGGAE